MVGSSAVTINDYADGSLAAHGSGVVLSDGTILTARHVVHNQSDIRVVGPDGREEKIERVLWEDEAHDVALVLPSAIYVAGSPLACGQQAIGTRIEAVGSPLDLGHNVHSYGRIASREIVTDDWQSAVVLDLTIAPGNSGGPVFNELGEVVGIAVGAPLAPIGGMFASLTGFSLMVPSSAICPVIEQHRIVSAPGV